FVPIFAQTGGQTHRLGLKGGLYSPSGDKSNIVGIEAELQFDAKIHPNFDAGPHFGIFIKNAKGTLSATEESKFIVVPITFQFRFYPIATEERGSTHGIFSPFLSCSLGYYFALLYESSLDLNLNQVPDGVGGLGGTIGAGIDFGVGANTAYFVEVTYRKSGIRSIRGYDLTLDGITASVGARF
ncbi:hypothetical protein ACFL2K_05340, partial [Candidatus Margulisiibacteriota bacterium]